MFDQILQVTKSSLEMLLTDPTRYGLNKDQLDTVEYYMCVWHGVRARG